MSKLTFNLALTLRNSLTTEKPKYFNLMTKKALTCLYQIYATHYYKLIPL